MTSSERFRQLGKRAGLILLIGLAYALFRAKTGLAIPCPFRAATGLYCPGCGVTRMCLALLRLDLAGAFRANPALMVLAFPLGGLLGSMAHGYVKTGRTRPTRGESLLIWTMAAALLVFGVLRNLPRFALLRP